MLLFQLLSLSFICTMWTKLTHKWSLTSSSSYVWVNPSLRVCNNSQSKGQWIIANKICGKRHGFRNISLLLSHIFYLSSSNNFFLYILDFFFKIFYGPTFSFSIKRSNSFLFYVYSIRHRTWKYGMNVKILFNMVWI